LHVEAIVKGIVQGVGFRPFIYRIAVENRLLGYVRNRGDAGVEIVAEGTNEAVTSFLKRLNEEKPPIAQIYDVFVTYANDTAGFTEFRILKSLEAGNSPGSVIPSDVAICDQCLRELRDPANTRYHYFFITCTQCGPRYTIIQGLPYDRPNTTMNDFPLCEACRKEYDDPSNRRFHAQTVACPHCGPHVLLTTNTGHPMSVDDPIWEAGRLVEKGFIVAIKGNGGFHVVASTTKSEPIARLRQVKHRSQKPFAIMGKDLEAVKSFAEIGDREERLLTSRIRPILLLKKSSNFYLSKLISPGLHTIGVMLPYTGLHYMLFDKVEEPAFIMTSANAPNEPIVIENSDAFKRLGNDVDYFLCHDRKIAQRCDDSVVRLNAAWQSILRRSRGYAPTPIQLSNHTGHSLGVGAEENVNACIIVGDKAFISQYVGDVESVETFAFLRAATDHLMNLTKGRIEAVGCDMHPRFITQKLAEEYGRRFDCPVIPVQHHYAHVLSLMGESGLDTVMGIVCDGAGYGLDGTIWGGEVLHCTFNGFTRVGHLQNQPMVGGDLATRYPLRMAASILGDEINLSEWLESKIKHFPYGEKEAQVILRQLEKDHLPVTSSCGRVLDAVSALLGICYERTYGGEPAMKLESVATRGEDVLKLTPRIKGNVVDTSYLVREVFDKRAVYSVTDLASSTEAYLANALASIAVEEANKRGIKVIGFSGGVAYNEHIVQVVNEHVRKKRLTFIVHREVPPGDGGIAFGQALAALRP
jgi:hydrogenase maturation protein HypF